MTCMIEGDFSSSSGNSSESLRVRSSRELASGLVDFTYCWKSPC